MKTTVLPFLSAFILLSVSAQAGSDHHEHDQNEHATSYKPDYDAHREHGVHVHGEARLTLVVEGNALEVMLESPADNLFGFEHSPLNATEKVHAEKVLSQMNQGEALFSFDAAADCKANTPAVESPFKTAGQEQAAHEAHADVDASYSFECKHVAKLNRVEFLLLKLFPSLRTLKVEYITDTQQGTKMMTRDDRVLELN